MIDGTAGENSCTQLLRTELALELRYGGESYSISSDNAGRSNVLTEVLQNSAHGDLIPVPVSGQLVHLWLSYVETHGGVFDVTSSDDVLLATVQARTQFPFARSPCAQHRNPSTIRVRQRDVQKQHQDMSRSYILHIETRELHV